MRAAVYLRVSTDEQAASGLGLDAQRHACVAWAAREGREVLGPFADEGVGGAVPLDRRPGLVDALAALRPGDVFLVAKRDRIGRDPMVTAMIEAAAAKKGARVVSAAGEGTDDDGPTGVLMRRIVDAFSEYERLLIKTRTKAALAAKARRGERVGMVPYGRRVDHDDPRRSKKSDRPAALVDEPAEQAALASIQAMRAAGLTLRAIAAELTARGVPTRGGAAAWSHSTVADILRRPNHA